MEPAVVVLVWVVLAIVPASIGAKKGRSWLGFFLFGLLFWPAALITALIIGPLESNIRRQPTMTGGLVDQRMLQCAECGASTPAAVSFCTTCRRPREQTTR